jgi:hypothetical protein
MLTTGSKIRVAARLAALIACAIVGYAATAQADPLPPPGPPISSADAVSFGAVAGTEFSGPVADFTVNDPLMAPWEFPVSVSWGDNGGSVGTITVEPSGAFLVSGTHTYSRPGTFSTTVLVAQPGGPNVVVYGTATVGTAPPAPAVSAVDPSSGPAAGGTSVTITGTDLTGTTDVEFGTTPASDFSVDSPTQITATAPPGGGIIDVTVTTPGGTSPTADGDEYTYIAAPTVSGIDPSSGPAAGSTSVTITGTDLTGTTDVEFGTTPASDFTVDSPTQITATAPPGSAGTVDVAVTTPGGTSPSADGDEYTYIAAPTISGIDPASGPATGGTSVTITGTDLTGASDVEFGTTPASDFTVDSPTQITATAPPGGGILDVTVTTPSGTSPASRGDLYTYVASPMVTGISPASGPILGGTVVTITGTDLNDATGVLFGGKPATSFTIDSPTQITAIAPPGNNTADVTVATLGGSSVANDVARFVYIAPPTVTGVSPSSGPTAGATSVTITGTDLTDASDVEFGGIPATDFTVDSPTQITASSPAGAGTVDVTVTTPGGTSATGAADLFSYAAPAVVQAAVPQTGSPTVSPKPSTVESNISAALAGTVNPQGLSTKAHFEYGLDFKYTNPATSGPNYDHATLDQTVGSDFVAHDVSTQLTGLVPNALYHARLVATNNAGTTFGPDVTFTTPAGAPPAAPDLGSSFNVAPVSGLVLIQVHGTFVPLTEVRSIRPGSLINTLRGTLNLITATGNKHKTQTGTFGGAVFRVTQIGHGQHKGLTTIALAEGGFKGAPSYSSCKQTKGKKASAAAVSKKVLQLLHSTDHHGSFRTKGKYSAATVRGTVWTMADRCDGTLTHVVKDSLVVNDFVLHISVVLHAGNSYLALAKHTKHR